MKETSNKQQTPAASDAGAVLAAIDRLPPWAKPIAEKHMKRYLAALDSLKDTKPGGAIDAMASTMPVLAQIAGEMAAEVKAEAARRGYALAVSAMKAARVEAEALAQSSRGGMPPKN